MRVLHVITSVNRGGAENHLVDLVQGQIRRGLTVMVVYLKGDGYWAAHLGSLGAEVRCADLRRYGELGPVWRLKSAIRAFQPDLVHSHMPPAQLYTRLALLGVWPRLPLVTSMHNDEPFYRGFGQRAAGTWVAARASQVIAISDAVRSYYCGTGMSLPADRVTTVRYGIDPEPYAEVDAGSVREVRRTLGASEGCFLIGTVARLAPQKALDVLLEGYALYRRQAAVPSRLALVGTGPLRAELEARARGLGIADEVVWAGFREDIPAVMNALDLFALTSVYEGFGLVLLEAMASGRPVVASRVSAIPEIVTHGVTGLLVAPRQPAELAHAFKVMEEPQRRTEYGEAGKARARSAFTLDRMVEETLRIYERAVQGVRMP